MVYNKDFVNSPMCDIVISLGFFLVHGASHGGTDDRVVMGKVYFVFNQGSVACVCRIGGRTRAVGSLKLLPYAGEYSGHIANVSRLVALRGCANQPTNRYPITLISVRRVMSRSHFPKYCNFQKLSFPSHFQKHHFYF